MKKYFLILVLILNSFAFYIDDEEYESFDNEEHNNKHVHWGYTGETGPEYWGYLKKEFHMCKDGKNQSPINITNAYETRLEPLRLHYMGTSKNIVNNGHTIQVNVDNDSYLEIDGRRFFLLQFHFHTPSENHINGRSFPMEAHFVHQDDEGDLAVVAVMFVEGKENRNFQKLVDNLPINSKISYAHIDFKSILPYRLSYYRFNGSLTTPPCSEGVRWIVLKKPVEVSHEQIEALHKLMHYNNRPIQPLNARIIVK